MRIPLVLLASLAASTCTALVFSACLSSAESPQRFDAGPAGTVNEPCAGANNAQCQDGLVCIVGDAPGSNTCRARCGTDESDPCGDAFICSGLVDAGTAGACIDAALQGESCQLRRCDEGLQCVLDEVDGGTDPLCRVTCPLVADAGPGCVDGGACIDFGDPAVGYCR